MPLDDVGRLQPVDPRLNLVDLAGVGDALLGLNLAIACEEGSIVPTLVQRAGRSAMTPAELLRGFDIPLGAALM